MKLEKYLADYIEQEKMGLTYDDGYEIQINTDSLQEIIKQGLDAFESTENVKIEIIDCPLDTITDNAFDGDDNDTKI